MAWKTTFKTKPRRRREGKTNYAKRLALLKSRVPRLVVRVKNSLVVAQVVNYAEKGDQTVVNTTSLELKKHGYKGHLGNAAAAYLTGFLCGLKALKKKVNEAVLDTGLHSNVRGSNIYAALQGAVDAGLKIPHSPEAFVQERALGKHIEKHKNITLNIENIREELKRSVNAITPARK